jgi:hypothetical protein
MSDIPVEIDWDDGNLVKCQKHGVSMEEIEQLLTSGLLRIFPDPTVHEDRKKRNRPDGRRATRFHRLDGAVDHQRDQAPSDQRALHARKRGQVL